MLSQMDDYPLHQIADLMRFVGTSDRNFYDRYYFNLHASSDDLFMVMGMGQYPTLDVQDAFVVVRRGDKHHVVRGSRELGHDRMDTSVGPIRIEVIKGLERVRFIVEERPGQPLAMDITWEGAIPAYQEPRHYIRKHGRVLFDSMRFAQTGCWSGSLRIGEETFEVTPDRWKGSRDRSWGIRPVGEFEPPGVHAGTPIMEGMWNYAPMQFDDFSILYIVNEHNDGQRVLEDAVRVWKDPARETEWLGRPEHEHHLVVAKPYQSFIDRSVIRFPDAPGGPLEVAVTPLTHVWVMVGTGYGLEPDWKHGMYKGKEVVEHFSLDVEQDKERMFGLVDNSARFELSSGEVGYGLFEYCFFGNFDRYGVA
ncbi:hypothetical protein [Haliea atlantica]|jgi:hypothetical protein|nr:hypothetical protein [Haliea sp.]MAL95121.1 hypothetical protein [Haliea sp.]|tara:strand:- start:431 stop:1525 length:1095 start_codon:yes stop_codon:yes gene_type:complete